MKLRWKHMYQGISQGNKIVEMLDRMAFDVDRIRTAFINADNEDGSGINLIDTGLMGEKLTKYKSINIITHKDNNENFWSKILNDKTPLLSRLGIGEIPSSSDIVSSALIQLFGNNEMVNSDIFDSMLSGTAISLSGTVVGHTNSILKQSSGYIDKDGIITTLYSKNTLARYAPYKTVAKIGSTLANGANVGFISADIVNTWTANSGNTNLQRIEKTGIQIAGDGVCFETGKQTAKIAAEGFEAGGVGAFISVPAAAFIDISVSEFVTYGQDKLYKRLNIK